MSAQPTPLDARWRVRPMSVDDLEQVARVERDAYAFPWTQGNFGDSLAAGYDAWVFESGRDLIGYAVVMWLPDEIHLLNISVAIAHQGQGYGRAMLRWLCTDAAQRGARSMLLEVRPTNVVARGLYASEGFEQIGLRRRYYPAPEGQREDALVLRKDLADE